MEDEECAKMFIHLQQYVPHLEKLISQLKDPKKENRELQLNKLEGLYSMITDKKKKLKIDTLRKCEDVILKILQKVNPNIVRQLKPFIHVNESPMIKVNNFKEESTIEPLNDQKYFDSLKFQAARARLNIISTPASPSPPKDSIPLVHLPIVIPTEKVKSPPDPHIFTINNWIIPLTRKESNFAPVDPPNYKTEKPDIYNIAAATLNASPKGVVFDRLGTKVDMSKPPLSEEDLQQLTTPHREVYYEDRNLEDLEDLRQKLQKKILKTETKLHLPDLRTKLLNKDKSPSVSREEPQLLINEKLLVLNQEKPLVLNQEKLQVLNQEKLQVLNQVKSPPPPQIEHKENESTKSKPNKDAEPQKVRDKSSEKSSSKKSNEEKQKKDEKTSSSKPKSSKVEKVIKDPSTQFGSLLSSIDEKILGDKKKDSGKRDTSVKSDKVKVEKKDSAKKDSNSHEKKDKDNRKSEDGSKRKDHHKSKSKDHSKNFSKSSSKDKESEKHKSSHSDKHKESSSKHSSKSNEKTATSNEKSASTEKSSSNVKSENSNSKSQNSDSKETHTFKRLADKYNPRPRKNSIEDILKSPVGDARTIAPPLVDPGITAHVLKDPRNPTHLKEFRDPRSANQRTDPRNAVHAAGDPRSAVHPIGDPRSAVHPIGDPRSAVHPIGDPRSVGHPVGDPRSVGHQIPDPRTVGHPVPDPRTVGHPVPDPRTVGHPDPRIVGLPIVDRRPAGHPIGDIRNNVHQIGAAQNFSVNYNANNNFFEPPINNDQYHFNKPQNSMEHNTVVVGNVPHRTLLPTPSHPIQMGFQQNNAMIRQNDFMQNNNQFIPPQQRMVNQNTLHQGNSFSNIYYKNNTNQMNNSGNIPYHGPSKAFHPYKPIESSSEYDLSKMQPVDFYSPAATQPVNKITSPPTYGNRNFVPQAPRMERSREETFRLAREQNQRLQHDSRKEDTSKLTASRDPRIRSREMKERSNNAAIPSKGPPAPAQSKPATGESHNKYDSLYSKLVDRKVPELFTSPLDSLYSSGELPKTTASKGYGFQNFKIPKKKADIKNKTKEYDQKEDSYKHDDKINDTKEPSSDDDVYEADIEVKKSEDEKSIVKSEEVKPVLNNEPEIIEPSSSDPNLLTELVTQMIQNSDKKKLLNTLLSSLEATGNKKNLVKRLKRAIECDEAEEDVSNSVVDTANDDRDVSSTTGETPKENEEETKTISKEAVSSDLVNDFEDNEEEKLDEEDSFEESDEEDKIKPKKITKRLINTRSTKKLRKKRRRRRRRGAKKTEDLNSSFEDNVVETVSERIKSQRRSVKIVDGKPRKCRTELDMLHEDIKEMFIRDGVLTANGKRMCTMLKGDKSDSEGVPNAPPVTDKNISKVVESEEPVLDSPKRRARDSNPKVLIEKTDLSKHTSQSVDESESESEDGRIPQRRTRSSLKNKLPKRHTRSSSRAANYKEDTSDDDNKLDQSKTAVVEEFKASEESKVSEDEFKASEDESKASEDVAIDESESTASSQVHNKKNKRKRRGYNWAAGIIHKRPKRKATSRPATPHLEEEQPPSEPEEAEIEETESPEIEYTEPDKNYYFDPQMKPDCKLCSFKGRMIIQHYRSNHPKNEVLISRLSPNIADTAINESKAKNYNEFEIPAEASQTKFRRNKYTFQCRFCQVFLKNESTEAFLDHLSSHTGEYRFLCHFCSFRTANCKSLRSHMHSSHNATSEQTGGITPTYPSPPDFNTLFGYICSECNFVQMNRSAMERHSKIIHVGDFSNIFKISMSMIPSKNPTVDENLELSKSKEISVEEAVPAQETSVEETGPAISEKAIDEVKPAEINEKAIDEVKTSTEIGEKAIDEVKTTEIDENMNAESADTQEPEELITAFTITDDQQGEIEKCAEKKQEKMEEIQKTIFPKKRSASNLLEKLKNRLNDKIIDQAVKKDGKDLETKEKNEIVRKVDAENKTTTSVEFLNDGPSTSTAEQKIQVKDIPVENDLIKKGLFDKRENKLEGITNIIERLQAKVADAQKLPTLIPIDEFNSQDVDFKPEEILCQVGPFITGKKKNVIYFVCYIKSCNFSSRNPADFKTHCTTLHSHDPWDGYCTTCNKKTNYTTAIGAYIHLIDIHAPKEISAKAKLIKEEPEKTKPYLRMRRLSGDKLSEKTEMLIPEATIKKEVDPDVEIIDDLPEEEPFSFPFQITNVTSLADEEEDETEKKWEVPDPPSPTNNTSNGPTIGIVLPILSSIKGSPPAPAATKPTSPRQLVVSPRAPVFTVASPQKIQSKKILLKDTPLQLDELLKPRKTKPALQALLSESKLKHLYKCPERSCHYSTDMKKHFEMHLKQHVEYNSGMQIPCLYCNFKTSFNLIGIHYDIRHSKCLFCCAFCFYRAINQSYVEIHQESEHTNKIRRVIIVPQNMDALMSQANIAIPHIRNVLTPYSCGQLGCEEKFIFENDFKIHLATVHKGIPLLCVCCPHSPVNEEAAVVHAQTHNVYYYNCRYCVNGSNDIDDIHKHLSLTHFALPPQIIVRQFQEKRSGKLSSDFSYNDDAVFDHVLVQSTENLEYITPSARVYSGVSSSVTPQSSVLKVQKNSPAETITLYKAPAPNPGIPVKYLKCSNNPKLKDVEVKKMNTDSEIVQVSDDEDDNEPVVPKPPIVLNSLIAQGKNILSLTNPKIANEKSKPEPVQNFISIQPEIINSDDCVIVPEESDKTVLTDEDPLKLDSDPLLTGENESNQDKMDMDVEETDISLEECNSNETLTRKQGLTGTSLFRCSNCKFGFKLSGAFRTHISLCVGGNVNTTKIAKPFKCYHCPKTCKSSNILMDHLRLHGTPRFSCSLCDFKHQHQTYVRSHMKVRHKVTSVSINPVVPHLTNYDEDCFIMKPKFIGRSVSKDSVASNVLQDFSQNNTMRVTFGPDQISQLPIRPIFNQNIVCSTCGYESKVRANLVRHLQFHLQNKEVPVPVSAPVNPVPCLDKNEKMFDKMTNLAHSSFSDKSRMSGPPVKRDISRISKEEESNFPCFVPSAKRYVCGAYNCQYLNQEESILRHHVQTFHTDEKLYKCLHCNKSLTIDNVVINVENILHHLKLHDLNLYKCKYCTFLHYQMQKIEAHVTEKHLDDRLHIVIVREMEQEPQDSPQVEEVKEKKPWRCGICKYRCTTKSEIVSHAFNKHEVEYQYNCAMCNFKSNEKNVFENHFRVNHVGHQIDVNSTYYEVADTLQVTKPVETEVFDTTPLWQRDKNKFKHIRGIPLEESIKVSKKSPFKAAPVFDNLDKSIEAVANGSATTVPKNSKAAVVKKPKTLKEKRMKEDNARAELFEHANDVDIVGLENDEFPFELTEKCFEEKDPITIIYNGKETSRELSTKDIQEMDLNMIKTAELSCVTGRFGKPANKEYLCPICEVFKSKRVIEFTQHLYKELEYDRFVCTRCGLSNASNKVLERHSIKKHPTASLAIHPLSPDNRIEDYVSKLLAYQQRVMFANAQPEIVEKKRDSNGSEELKSPEKCQYCTYTSKYYADLKKHEVRHWAVKPYKCGVCSFEGVTSSEVMQHSRRIHVNRQPDVITVQLPENPVIIPISRKRRYNHKIDSDASSDAFEFSENSSDIVLPDTSDSMDNGNDEIVFVCHYCPKRGTNESEIRDHWELVHKPKSMIFKIKKVKRSDLIKPTSILYYKCGYCDVRTQFDNIRKHCKKAHPEMTFSAFRFKCGKKECNEYLKSYDHAKTHFNFSHPGSKISYIDVPKVAGVTAQINCEFCSLKFDSREKFSLHQKEMHSHLLPSFTTSEVPRPSPAEAEVNRYKCPECNHKSCNYAAMRDHVRSHAKPFVCHYCSQRFLYPSVVKTHHNREHRDLEFKYETDDVAMKRNDYLRSNILVLGADGTYVKNKNSKTIKRNLPSSTEVSKESTELAAPPPPKKFKATARKSTTKQSLVNNTVAEEGYSYYGCKPDLKEIGSIKASLPFLDTMVQISLSDLTFINIFPVVEVEDFKNKLRF